MKAVWKDEVKSSDLVMISMVAAVGAPAFRYSFQQVNHLFSSVAMQTLNHTSTPCEFDVIVKATIAACIPLDGLVDGVVSRTDLCKLQFNLSSLIATPYYCSN